MKKVTFQTSVRIEDGGPVDKRHIPWQSPAWVIVNIPADQRYLGLTVPVLIGGTIVEYWWRDNLTDAGLVMKPSISQVTTAERDAIPTPYEGYEIYNLTSHTKEYFDGTVWKTVATTV